MLGRLLAAVSYIGLTGALVPLAQPENPFVMRHARQAIFWHLLRIALIAPVLALTVTETRAQPTGDAFLAFAGNLSLLVLVGLPLVDLLVNDLNVWVIGVLLVTWGAESVGIVLALGGLTADWQAFFHADWPNRSGGDQDWLTDSPRNLSEKEALTRQREGRLARVRAADSVAALERRRRGSLEELRAEFDAASARRAHLTQLLQLGEISERRYTEGCRQLDASLAELSAQIAILGTRRVSVNELDGRQRRELPTDLLVHVPLQTLAISGHNGLPLCTYGNFPLDEVLVTGILAAFNSLSEEVFGAHVHKTQLAEGQLLSFVHARWTVTMAVFDEEPSPTQLRMLRDLVTEFERVNSRELSRPAPDPARLQEVKVPFTFIAATG